MLLTDYLSDGLRCAVCVCSDDFSNVNCASKALSSPPSLPRRAFLKARGLSLRTNDIKDVSVGYLQKFAAGLLELDISDQQHGGCVRVPVRGFPNLSVKGNVCRNLPSIPFPLPIFPIGVKTTISDDVTTEADITTPTSDDVTTEADITTPTSDTVTTEAVITTEGVDETPRAPSAPEQENIDEVEDEVDEVAEHERPPPYNRDYPRRNPDRLARHRPWPLALAIATGVLSFVLLTVAIAAGMYCCRHKLGRCCHHRRRNRPYRPRSRERAIPSLQAAIQVHEIDSSGIEEMRMSELSLPAAIAAPIGPATFPKNLKATLSSKLPPPPTSDSVEFPLPPDPHEFMEVLAAARNTQPESQVDTSSGSSDDNTILDMGLCRIQQVKKHHAN
jgi:hypothetical protein